MSQSGLCILDMMASISAIASEYFMFSLIMPVKIDVTIRFQNYKKYGYYPNLFYELIFKFHF